jgi:UDP-N-acetylmuramoylalanine--D-glutamate ligase
MLKNMRVFHSKLLSDIPGIVQGTASLDFRPLTFRGHRRAEVVHSRKKFFKVLGLKPSQAVFGNQVHGSRVRIVTEKNSGAGWSSPHTYLSSTDGLLTQKPSLAVGVFTADCVPVLLVDPISGWIGAIHVGWKGLVKGILHKAITELKSHDVKIEYLHVWLGPCICEKCYSVSQPSRYRLLIKSLGSNALKKRNNLWYVNFPLGIYNQLIKMGLKEKNIEISKVCTKTCKILPSARRDGYNKHENTLTLISRKANMFDLRGKNVVIFGLGTQGGGEASVQYAIQNHAQVTVADEKQKSNFISVLKRIENPKLNYAFGKKVKPVLKTADIIIKNPGIPPNRPELLKAKKRGAVIIGDLGLYRACSSNPLIAVTGTKGKTTVAAWLASMLKKSNKKTVLAGNLRQSPLLIPEAYDGQTPVVLETSSFQLEDTKEFPLHPQLAIYTNLFPDHLNRHGSLKKYAKAKALLLNKQIKSDSVILPYGEAWANSYSKLTKAKSYWFSLIRQTKADAWIDNNLIYIRWQGKVNKVFDLTKLHFNNQAFVINALIVALAGYILKLKNVDIQQSLQKFSGVSYRYELIREFRGRKFINDTTATNPGAAIMSIKSTNSPCVLIAGGADKNLPLKEFAETIQKNVREVILLPGSATDKLKKTFITHIHQVNSMAQAVKKALQISKSGDTILLSPGAASFGLFKNEFDRGDQFNRCVKNLR